MLPSEPPQDRGPRRDPRARPLELRPALPADSRPVGPVLIATGAAVVLSLAATWPVGTGDPSTGTFYLAIALPQVILVLCAVVVGVSSRGFLRSFLLVTPRLGWHWVPILCVATFVPAFVGSLLRAAVSSLVGFGVEPIDRLMKEVNALPLAPTLLVLAVLPGFCEEFFFRGFVQRRLLGRLPAGAAISISSALFAAFHLTPGHVAFAYAVGLWFGLVAWRMDSVWPSIFCHTVLNGTVLVLTKTVPQGPPADQQISMWWLALLAFALVSLFAFVSLLPVLLPRSQERS